MRITGGIVHITARSDWACAKWTGADSYCQIVEEYCTGLQYLIDMHQLITRMAADRCPYGSGGTRHKR